MAKITISLSAAVVGRSSLWNELAARKKAGKITQTQYNDCIKLLNSDPKKLKDLIAKGLSPAKAATSVIRSVSSVESTSGATGHGIRLYLQKRVQAKVITAAQMQNVLDWIEKHPMEFRQASKQYNSDGIGASRIFNRVNGKPLPPMPKSA